MIQDVAVIGNGIVGQIAIQELSDAGLKIVVIDQINPSPQVRFHRDLEGKQSVWTRGTRVAGFPGGRLNWGQNCSFATIEGHPPLGSEFQTLLPNLTKRLRRHGFPRLKPCELSISRTGKFYVRESSKFVPDKWMSRMKLNKNIQFISGIAMEVVQDSGDFVKIIYRDSNNSLQDVTAKKILICAGPFGSQELLANSGLLENWTPQIWDHPSIDLGIFPLRQVKLAKFGLFGWNRFRRLNLKSCFTFYDDRNNTLWTLRIFPWDVLNSNQIVTRIKTQAIKGDFKPFVFLLLKLASSFVTGRFLHEQIKVHLTPDFLDESNAIKFASYGEGSRIDFLEYQDSPPTISNELNQFICESIKNLKLNLKDEIVSFNSPKLSDIQSSSHHAGTLAGKSRNSEDSPTEITRNVFVAGSSIFRRSLPGHPTMMAAATAIVAADLIKSQLT